MSLQQQAARITEAPTTGWVIWLSEEALQLVKELLESVESEDGAPFELATQILEGIY